MIVRTYGRRSNNNSRNTNSSNPNSFNFNDTYELDEFTDNLSQHSDDIFNFPLISQESTKHHYSANSFDSDPYSFDSCEDLSNLTVLPPRPKKLKTELNNIKKDKKGKKELVVFNETTTLMETQECGEMMEHVDEVEFALDGLRRGQPIRVRRGSLLALLSVCGSLSHRRLVRTHG